MDIKAILAASLPRPLVEALVTPFREIETHFVHRRWKASELDSGHFVEAARRTIEHRLFGAYPPIGKSLPVFSDKVLLQYEQAAGDESYRILIPRVLKAIYGVRNKRGVAHLGPISPNEMDATLILYNVKWVLAEIIRLESGLSPAETQQAIGYVVERQTTVVWKEGDIVRIADKGLSARQQAILLLYDSSPQTAPELQARCEYRNATNFRKILQRLHSEKVIFLAPDGTCLIMPNGVVVAEAMLRDRS